MPTDNHRVVSGSTRHPEWRHPFLDGGFMQSVRLVVDRVGFAADPEIRSSQEVAVATAPKPPTKPAWSSPAATTERRKLVRPLVGRGVSPWPAVGTS